jgi:mono/diheme cytochrome c family protein
MGVAKAILAFGVLVLGAGAVALALTVWRAEPDAPAALIDASDPRLVARGRVVYDANCASCHGAQLEGQADWQRRRPDGRLPAPPHDATGHTWHHDDATLLRLTLQGPAAFAGAGYATDMPAYEGVLPVDDVRAALAFIKSTWPPDILARQAAAGAATRRAAEPGR